ncbi:MAG: CpsD/CapB family tyrosine-protein kinase [Bacillota bacterium]|jgi:protein-tyrosine kinase
MKNPFKKKILESPRKLYTLDHPKASISEAFRMLRTNLMYTGVDRELRVLLLTSSGPQEGKSTTAANLAVALAQAGKKVLIMDCDLRKPVQHEIFGLQKDIGLTKYLAGYCTWEEIIQKTKLPNLSMISSGPTPPNPAEILGSSIMDKLLEIVRAQFDFVVVDSPPAVTVTDAIILASKCDGVLVVVRSGITRIAVIKETYELLKSADAHVIGAILNGVSQSAKRYGKYYRNYYNSYYEDE